MRVSVQEISKNISEFLEIMPGKGKFLSLRLTFWSLYPPPAVTQTDRHLTAHRTHLVGALL